jgi:DNA-binding MarR family transcriptional regulator
MNYDKVGILIKFIENVIKTDRNNILKEIDLSTAQGDVLTYLLFHQEYEINQKDIEKEFRIKNPTVTGILKRLELKSLIKREVSARDSRSKKIIVTDKSKQLQKEISDMGELIENKLTNGFSQQEREELLILLQRVLKNLKNDDARSGEINWRSNRGKK